MSDIADNAAELIQFTLDNALRARRNAAARPIPACEECGLVPAMKLPNGVQARYCADCWTEIRGAE